MTLKVGEPGAAAAAPGRSHEVKLSKLRDFSSLLQQLMGASVSRPAEAWRASTDVTADALGEGVRPFTPGGTAPEADGNAALVAPIDALELSLSRPAFPAARVELPQCAAVASDAAEVAALERVVERVSFGSDRSAAVARLQLGGIWAGAVLVVRASGRRVELQLELAREDGAARELGERLASRLRSRGFATALSFS